MKIKKIGFLIINILFIIVNDCWQQENYTLNEYYSNYKFSFTSLNTHEILDYSFNRFKRDNEEYTLQIYALNTITMHKRLIGYWDVQYGFYQFSADRKSCIFLMQSKTWYKSLFFIDGINGLVSYLVDINIPMMTSKDLNFVLFKKHTTENTENIELVLLDLRDFTTRVIILNFNPYPSN
jgi:hypothetical protein